MKTSSSSTLEACICSIAMGMLAAPVCAQATSARPETTSRLERLPDSEWTIDAARHLLFRAGFGGTPEDVRSLHARGLQGAVDWLVDYERQPDVVGPLSIQPTPRPAPQMMRGLSEEERKMKVGEVRRDDGQRLAEVIDWWYQRLVQSQRPLEEKMTLFWHGHFTSSYQDVRNAYHMFQQNQLLRDHATGNFRSLVHEMSRDPAMLEYLDNNRSNRRAPNENYARELMELFTLGAGNYTEKDIKEAARAFTGWTFRDSVFQFNRGAHDPGLKTFLGKTGAFGGDQIIDIILQQDAAPRHLASRLLEFFLTAHPASDTVEQIARVIRKSDYEIKPALRLLFASRLFHDPALRGAQVKSPVMLVTSMARQLGVHPPTRFLALTSSGLGQNLLFPPNVKGWEGGTAWITTSNLLNRYNVAGAMIEGNAGPAGRAGPPGRDGGGKLLAQLAEGDDEPQQRRGTPPRRREMLQRRGSSWAVAIRTLVPDGATAEEVVDLLTGRFLLVRLSAEKRSALVEFVEGKDGSKPLDLRGPGAEAKLRSLLHLIMSTPEFQVC